MPVDEIRIVLTTRDRELVRRHLELHRERLEERLDDQRRKLAAVERLLGDMDKVRPRSRPGVVASPRLEVRPREPAG
jgi:hypothetical protein